MPTPVTEVIEFLSTVAKKGFVNDNTAVARRTACRKFFEILGEEEQTVEYVANNLNTIRARFMNLNKEVNGGTVDEYARRVQIVLNDFSAWRMDRAAWERDVSNRSTIRSKTEGDTTKKQREKNTIKATKENKNAPDHETSHKNNSSTLENRSVSFPIRADFDLTITLPRDGLTVLELKKLAHFLLPYAKDWDPKDTRSSFLALDRE